MSTPTSNTTEDEGLTELSRALHHLDEAHRQFRGYAGRHLLLSSTELTTLLLVDDYPGISPRQISSDLGLSTGAVTALLDRLEDAGHVVRESSATDRRSLRIEFTESGRQAIEQIRRAYRLIVASSLASTRATPDTVQLLKRIAAELDDLVALDTPLPEL